jgi:MFS family permease
MRQAERVSALNEPQKPPSAAKRGYILGLLTAIWALSMLDRNVMSILIDPIKKELNLTDTMLGLMMGFGFVLIYLLLSLPVSRYADRRARIPIISTGLALWSLMTGLGGLAHSGFQMFLFRLGVGVGESTGVAPSVSLISDYFPKDRRPMAMSIFAMAPVIGVGLGFLIGGLTAHYYGWRASFFVAGIPGIIIALLLRFTVREPLRGLSDGPRAETQTFTLGSTIRYFAANRTLLLVFAGFIFITYSNYAFATWMPAFLGRVHKVNMARIGMMAGLIYLVFSIVGSLLGGVITTAASRKDDRWRITTPGIVNLLAGPAMLLFLLPGSLPVVWFGLGLSAVLLAFAMGPQAAVIQTIVKVRMRAFAGSVTMTGATLFGMGFGPLVVAMVSDSLKPRFGALALRYSMLTAVIALILSGVCYIWASAYIKADMRKAQEEASGIA